MRIEFRPLWSLSLLFLGACTGASARPGDPVGSPVQPMISLVGPDSGIRVRAYHRLRSPEALRAVWQQHTTDRPPSPIGKSPHSSSLPEVDFATCEVVALFAGTGRNSDGLSAVSVVDEPGCRRLRFHHLGYQTDGPRGGVRKVTAFGFFVLPRSDLPLVLEQDVKRLIGDPPLWQEMARL